jgi:signal transduction histidine kinase
LVRHILMNLLSNALKYSPAGAPVGIRLAADANLLRISVEDRGIGIPPGDQARLFEEFFRASNVGNVRGTGVGLSIARECARLHGGRLSFQSVPGRGTTFIVEIPHD